MKWFKNLFKRGPYFDIIVIDWFKEMPPCYPALKFMPKRCNNDFFDRGIESLIEGEVLVNMEERRIFQKLDGKIVEWKQVCVK